jgi:hypothetical protein
LSEAETETGREVPTVTEEPLAGAVMETEGGVVSVGAEVFTMTLADVVPPAPVQETV